MQFQVVSNQTSTPLRPESTNPITSIEASIEDNAV